VKKLVTIALPVLAICLFILVMVSGSFLKRPLGQDDDVPGSIERLKRIVLDESWDQADIAADELIAAWEKVVLRVQFSAERDEINSLSDNLARLKGAVQARDKAGALMELYEAYRHWEDLGR